MKIKKSISLFCILISICSLQSCLNNDRVREKTLTIELKHFGLTKDFFDSICLNQLEQSFKKYDVWPTNAEIIEACTIEFAHFRLNLNKKLMNDYIFIGFLYSVLDAEFIEIYMYDKSFGDFTPIRLIDDLVVQDTTLLVRLYLNGGITCGDIELKGSDSENPKKNGVFMKQNYN